MRTLPLLLVLAACASTPRAPSAAAPPQDASVHETLFGHDVEDPFRWLEKGDAPEVQAWMDRQDAAARAALARMPEREQFKKRLGELLYTGSVDLPLERGGKLFYLRRAPGKEKAALMWRPAQGGEERLLLDPATLAPEGTIALGAWMPSWDGRKLAYVLHPNNADRGVIHVLDVEDGKVSGVDVIPGGRYARPSWLPDASGFYYVNQPEPPGVAEADLPGLQEVRLHRLGTDPQTDPVAMPARHDPELGIGAEVSRDGHWLFVSVSRGWSRTDLSFRDLRQPQGALQPLIVGVEAVSSVEALDDRFYVLTNDGAPHGRIFRADPAHPARSEWKELVPERKELVIQAARLTGGKMALTLLGAFAANALELRGLDGTLLHTVKLPGVGVLSDHFDEDPVTGAPDQPFAYYKFSSPILPRQIFRLEVKTGASTLIDAVKLPFDPSAFAVETAWYPSKDGTPVSIYLVHRKDQPRDGTTPYLLSGYGGFNIPRQPVFEAAVLPWLEHGGGYAVAQIRGGGEYGEAWHQAGMGPRKQNVFDDFIAAAQWLAAQRYTAAPHLAIRGGSNGGLLVGAVMTQRPELFGAVICAVPLLDMVRYHRFGEGKTWVPEYGSSESAEGLATLLAYSPYHHVQAGTRYPPLLMLSADADDRVDPLHARKFVALLQARGAPGTEALLRIERHAGHGGADRVLQTLEQTADIDAFLLQHLR